MFRRRLFGIIPPPIINYSVSGSIATVTINSNYNIRYTTAKDNEPSYNPTYSYGTVYNNQFNILGPGEYTIKAIAYDRNNHYSTISEKTFEITEKNCNYEFTEPLPVTGLIYDGLEHNLFSGGSSSVGNNFEYPKGREAKTYYGVTWEFTPNNPDLYCTKHGSGDVTIDKASQAKPTATGATTTYPNVAEATATGGGEHGSLEWSNGNLLSTVGSKTTKARWAGDSNYYPSDWSNEVTLKVNSGDIAFNAPTKKTGLTYTGSPLTLYNEGSSNEGTFKYINGTATNAGTYTVTWIFTPTDSNYEPLSGSFEVEIGKANPIYIAPTKKTGLVYDIVDLALLNAGSTSNGTIQYSNNNINWSTTIPTAVNANPTTGYSVYWRLVGDNNHNDVPSTEISGILIAKVTPVLSTNPTKASDWTYDGSTRPLASGGAMKHSNTNSTVVPGTFTYNNATNIGTYTATWSFAPNDTTNYNNVGPVNIGQVTVMNVGEPTAPTSKSLTYNGNAQVLINRGSVDPNTNGTMVYSLTPTNSNSWTSDYTQITGTDARDYTVYWKVVNGTNKLFPTDADYRTVTVNIGKASISPSVTINDWTYGGTASTPTVLGNSGNGPVTYTYYNGNNPLLDVPSDAGDNYKLVINIPETSNYLSGTAYATFKINKAPTSVTVTMNNWTYGDTSSNHDPSITTNPNGMTYNTEYYINNLWVSNKPSDVGNYIVKVTIPGTSNYEGSEDTCNFTISENCTYSFTEPSINNLTYNGESQTLLTDGSASINGVWNYNPESAENVGIYNVNWTFDPGNGYCEKSGTKLVEIKQMKQTVKFIDWVSESPECIDDFYSKDLNIYTTIEETPVSPLGGKITYSSSNPNVASIDEYGIITPGRYNSEGNNTCIITVTKGSDENGNYEVATDSKEFTIHIDYLTFVPDQYSDNPGSKIKFFSNATNLNLQYSKDLGETWLNVTSGSDITLEEGVKKVFFKGNNSNIDSFNFGTFELTGDFNLEGNIMTLIQEDGNCDITKESLFLSLFSGCTGLIDVSKLKLSSNIVKPYCYKNMFDGCTSLIYAPAKLPALSLASYCYDGMFRNCTFLETTPILPATTLAEGCYRDMFNGCTSLVNVFNALPATTLTDYCYNRMFNGCTSLKVAPELSAVLLRKGCCASMFEGCISLEKAPVLKAVTFFHTTNANNSDSCYSSMFKGCRKLNWIKAMFTTDVSTSPNSSYGYTSDWVNGVASSGTFIKNSAATWNLTGNNGIPSGWTVLTASS